MPITLITGPANAGKALEVLGAMRGHLAHGQEPLLIVPTRADVEHYRRELAQEGVVLGARVERFEGLIGEVVRCAGGSEPVVGRLARERVLAAVSRGSPARSAPDLVSASGLVGAPDPVGVPGLEGASGLVSASGLVGAPDPVGVPGFLGAPDLSAPGFVNALAGLVAELEVQRVTPARLEGALKAWAGADGAGAVGGAVELSRLWGEYRKLLKRIGRIDLERQAAQALDALRLKPALWGATPVLIYGFDDFGAQQLDAIETLGARVDAEVTVSLTYEPGRTAFAGRAGTFETLRPLAAEYRRLEARAEYYGPNARTALHHLERSLFEPGAARVDAGAAVRLLEGGGERAELELVAREVKLLLDGGMKEEEIAIVHRSPSAVAELLGEVLAGQGIEYALERRIGFADTATGRALVGALRCTTDAGELGDLLAWLRAPGLLSHPELADRLEARARREGVKSAARARAIWEAEHWRLEALDHLRDAARRGGGALCERAARELAWLFNAPRRGRAAILEHDELDEARALTVGRRALGELGRFARAAPGPGVNVPGRRGDGAGRGSDVPGRGDHAAGRGGDGVGRGAAVPGLGMDATELASVLAGLEIFGGERAGEGRVAVVDPLALRARRVRALFLTGLQEGVFPASARLEPLLAEEERRRLAETSGLLLGGARQGDALAAERYALYAAVSRPEELLVLSWHAGDDDGVAQARSLFVDDVADLFQTGLEERRARRPLGAVGWHESEGLATGTGDRARSARSPIPLGPLRDGELREELREHVWSASSLEVWRQCPVKWFVQRMLRADDLDPEPEPLARGALAHAVLKDTLESLREKTGSARLTPARLGFAKELLSEALASRASEFPLSATPERRPGLRRRLEADLERYLQHASERESVLEPTYLELGFGFGEADEDSTLPSLPALDLGDGLRLRGRIDRVDVAAGGTRAVVYDYKGRNAPAAAKWTDQGNVQVALYMRAVEELLGLEATGGFYQPLSGSDLRARGVLDGESGVEIECVRGELREHEQVRELLGEAVATAREAAAQAARGELEPRPKTCAYRGGCMFPTICRCET